MSKAAFTIKVFAVYLVVLAVSLILVPNLLLAVFGLPATNEVWIRVLGVVVLILGGYYWLAAKNEAAWFFQFSVYGRSFVLAVFIAFVIAKLVSPVLILFGAVDLLGALWTFAALRHVAQRG